MGWIMTRRTSTARAVLVGLALLVPLGAAANERSEAPIPAAVLALMKARGTSAAAPLLIRSYKKEAELEVWKMAADGRYVFLKTYPICRWSGQLGPKRHAGDRQTPEGFYSVGPRQMNPNSHYYLSFDTGFPNAYDKAHGASGSALMVHGICSSAGCYAMTNPQIGEIYAIARDAIAGGQKAFQVQAFPFRMSAANMARYRLDANIDFWRQLKEGADRFDASGEEPVVGVSGGRYAFAPLPDAAKEAAAQAFHTSEAARTAALVADGAGAFRATYADGGQNASFAKAMLRGDLGEVSRPEALAAAGIEVTLIPTHVKAHPAPPPASLAAAMPAPPASASPPPALAGAAPVLPAAFTPWPAVQIAATSASRSALRP